MCQDSAEEWVEAQPSKQLPKAWQTSGEPTSSDTSGTTQPNVQVRFASSSNYNINMFLFHNVVVPKLQFTGTTDGCRDLKWCFLELKRSFPTQSVGLISPQRDEWMTFDFLAMKTISTSERRAEKERQKGEERARAQAVEQVCARLVVKEEWINKKMDFYRPSTTAIKENACK